MVTKKDALDQLAHYVFNGEMSFLNILRIGARHSYYHFRNRSQATAVSRERDGAHIPFFCRLDSPNKVWRITARADAEEDVPRAC